MSSSGGQGAGRTGRTRRDGKQQNGTAGGTGGAERPGKPAASAKQVLGGTLGLHSPGLGRGALEATAQQGTRFGVIFVLTVGSLVGQTRSVVSVTDLGKVGIRSVMENGMWRDLSGDSFSAFVVNL